MRATLTVIPLLFTLPVAALGARGGGGPSSSNGNDHDGTMLRRNLDFGSFGEWQYSPRKKRDPTKSVVDSTAIMASGGECANSDDCEEGSYCATGECLTMGSCETEWDCLNPVNSYSVIECTGPILCDEGTKQCGRECGPVCPDGTFGVQCSVEPCSIADTTCRGKFTSCQNDYCGGCNSLVFNDKGSHEVCSDPSTLMMPAEGNSVVLPTACNSTMDCGDEEFCSSGICTEFGKCSDIADCFNPDNIYGVVFCIGPLSCDLGQCGRTCSDDNCPADQPLVECLASPCDIIGKTCEDEVASCVDNYCGGCNAYAFDDAGFQVCEGTSDAVDSIALPTSACNSTMECGEFEFCSNGICTEFGKCSDVADCFNADNIYAVALCVGPITCELGQCGRFTCSGSDCPDDQPLVRCLTAPCDVIQSSCEDEVASCADNYCGGCKAYAFDEAGFQVCEDTSSAAVDAIALPPRATTCNSSMECGEFEFCSNGICTEFGICSDVADCFNPENIYGVVFCVGPITCELGKCGRYSCSGSDCPADQPPVECFAAPCDVLPSSCEDEVASCVDNYCGGCNAFAFDEAGSRVCTGTSSDPVDSSTACSRTEDCAEGEYCAGGECLPDGQCNKDIDCKHPENLYPVVACVGVIGCNGDGACGVECGASFCPPGSVEANCITSPCDSPPSCQESWEYCIDDYCNGVCGVILLDAAGNEVTCTPV